MNANPLTQAQQDALYKIYYTDAIRLGRDRLYRKVNEDNPNLFITKVQVQKYLNSQVQYQLDLRKKTPKHLEASRMTSVRPFSFIQIDLISKNPTGTARQYKYIFTCIDLFSRYAFAYPIFNKTARTIKNCFEKVYDEVEDLLVAKGLNYDPVIDLLSCDNGTEFKNKTMEDYLTLIGCNVSYGVPYISQSQAFVESFNKTFSMLLNHFAEMKRNGQGRRIPWNQCVAPVVKIYNESYHSSIQMTPIEALAQNLNAILNHYRRIGQLPVQVRPREKKYRRGTVVRHIIQKGKLAKRTSNNWSTDLFEVETSHKSKTINGARNYKIKNQLTGVIYPRSFVKEELQEIKM